jgi:hypothetical protein
LVRHVVVELTVDHPVQPLFDRAVGRDRVLVQLEEHLGVPVHDGGEQGVLALEHGVDRGRRESGCRGDLPHRGALETGRCEGLLGRVEEVVAAQFGLALAQ